MTPARTWAGCVAWVAVAVCLLLGPVWAHAQTLADRLAPLALDPEGVADPASGLQCATPLAPRPRLSGAFAADPSRAGVAGEMEPLPDGRPLYADQVPRFLRPNHEGTFGFDRFLVLGDYETVTFERVDGEAENQHTVETWSRTGTDAVRGRLVSVFHPAWDASVLRKALRGGTRGASTRRRSIGGGSSCPVPPQRTRRAPRATRARCTATSDVPLVGYHPLTLYRMGLLHAVREVPAGIIEELTATALEGGIPCRLRAAAGSQPSNRRMATTAPTIAPA